MKKNIAMRVASLILMCTIVTSCFVGSTFAKYTSSVSGTSTATVAKWSIKLDDTDITKTDSVTFNLFSTILDTDGSAETDVAAGKIAPGTKGTFAFGSIKNLSEVTAKFTISFTVNNPSNVPLIFKAGDTKITPTDGVYKVCTDQTVAIGATASSIPSITWEWVYENGSDATLATNDATDTALGTAGSAPVVEVTATIVATQVD